MPTLQVMFPNGETRDVLAEYSKPPGIVGSVEYLAHKPVLTPLAPLGYSIHQLTTGEWIALPSTTFNSIRVPYRRTYPVSDEGDSD
jgi:hypothetical protein